MPTIPSIVPAGIVSGLFTKNVGLSKLEIA